MATSVEKTLERDFVKWCRDKDIIAVKGPANTARGIPDRIIPLNNNGGTIYVEFKGDDSYYGLTPIQTWWKEYLEKSNKNRYFVVETIEQLDKLKKTCEVLMAVGDAVVAYENKLLEKL